jgi:TPR repeat protein
MQDQGVGGPVDRDAARRGYNRAAEAGVPAAQTIVARRNLASAEGDPGEAAALLAAAADAGFAPASTDLGLLHLKGLGVPEDREEAMRRFRVAAEAGDPRAAHALGVLHEHPKTGDADRATARRWYAFAASRGHGLAAARLAALEGAESRAAAGAERATDSSSD